MKYQISLANNLFIFLVPDTSWYYKSQYYFACNNSNIFYLCLANSTGEIYPAFMFMWAFITPLICHISQRFTNVHKLSCNITHVFCSIFTNMQMVICYASICLYIILLPFSLCSFISSFVIHLVLFTWGLLCSYYHLVLVLWLHYHV